MGGTREKGWKVCGWDERKGIGVWVGRGKRDGRWVDGARDKGWTEGGWDEGIGMEGGWVGRTREKGAIFS